MFGHELVIVIIPFAARNPRNLPDVFLNSSFVLGSFLSLQHGKELFDHRGIDEFLVCGPG